MEESPISTPIGKYLRQPRVTCGAVSGSLLPLIFKRLGLDPALMSNPFVAGLSDILAIVIYMTVALTLLAATQ